ncbi:MAG: hypothetical protein AAGB26_13950 [Planctomycetota bacterium]
MDFDDMGQGGHTRVEARLRYPEHQLKPRDFLRFIQLGTFQEDWERLEMTDDDLMTLEVMIMAGPDEIQPVDGTGGFRLCQFVPTPSRKERPNGINVGYAYFPESSVATLLVAADLNEPIGLTPQMKTQMKETIDFIYERLRTGD